MCINEFRRAISLVRAEYVGATREYPTSRRSRALTKRRYLFCGCHAQRFRVPSVVALLIAVRRPIAMRQ